MNDINVSYGTWPFRRFPFGSLEALREHLAVEGIEHALVSHLGAIFHPDPDPFNLALIDDAALLPGVYPVPVANPAFPGDMRRIEAYRRVTDLKAVKLYPTFHNYALTSDVVDPLAAYAIANDIKLLVTMRVEDERMQYFALRIQGVPVDDIVALHRRYPNLSFVCLNAYLPEARRIGRETSRVGVDTAFAEWLFTAALLREDLSAERIFFGSHTPFLYTGASAAKISGSTLPDVEKQRILVGNAQSSFGLG